MRSERAIFLTIVVLLTAAAAPALAQSPVAHLDVDAQPTCSTRDELIARVFARSTRIRFVDETAHIPNLTARIEAGFRGVVVAQLDVVEPDGRKFSRRLEAPSCVAATDALALVVAITLDPSAATSDASKPPDTAGSPPPPKQPEATVPETPPRPKPETVPAPAPAHTRLTVGVLGEAVSGPAPTLMAGVGLEGEASFERASILSPAVVLTVSHLWSGAVTVTLDDSIAEFSLDLLTLDLCPVRVGILALEARACAAGSLGRMAAQGSRTYSPMSSARPFATAGATARLVLPLGSRVAIRGRVGAEAALWRDAFQFIPDVFHRVASVTLMGDVGVGVQFQ